MSVPALRRNPLFEDLEPDELADLSWRMAPRRFEPGETICREGEPGESLFLVADGFARVVRADADGEQRTVARLRRGDVLGEMSLLTGEPRSATVVAATQTAALELGRKEFAELIGRYPRILENVTRILSRRLAETTARVSEPRSRGEAVLLVVGESAMQLLPAVLTQTSGASPGPVATVDARLDAAQALAALDDTLADHRSAMLVADLGTSELPLLVDAADRAVALTGTARELAQLADALGRAPAGGGKVSVVGLPEGPEEAAAIARGGGTATPVVRVLEPGRPPAGGDLGWLGRYLARTRLGLALGAGGAKGYAHVGALSVLSQAGYAIDCVGGSSIGAVIGSWLALGMDAEEIDRTMRRTFGPEVVDDMFKLSLSGRSTGLETLTRALRESTGERTFDDLLLPLVVMTVDLNARAPAPVGDGPLWEALVAATAVAGMFPPYERDGQRLVDGLALVPVPTDAVADAGADVVVSVNLMSRRTLAAWPGEQPPPAEEQSGSARILDTLLEVMDLAQLDSSEQHAARADVVVTPQFGPGSWRDFHLADLFLEAGRRAAEEQLPALAALARPGPTS